MSSPGKVLVVDDEKNIRRTLGMVLRGEGCEVLEAAGVGEAERVIGDTSDLDLVMLDVMLGDGNGIDLLRKIKGRDGASAPLNPDIAVVMISGHASIDDAVQATRLGAFDFLEKPLDRDRVVVTTRNAIDRRQMIRQVTRLRAEVDARYELLGDAPVMETLKRQIARVAPTRSRVLITGESGTGKELIARAIHRNSSVASGAFVKVNCAAIPPELIESELFGHERGAFTGAHARKRGLFEVADGGTIFLDEMGDMSPSAQAKVLRVLQTGEFTRVGGEQSITVDVRVVAATNRNLEKMVEAGTFREDLYFRLNVFPIVSPRLADRTEDIPILAEAFMRECCDENGFAYKLIENSVLEPLMEHSWPGNVRELRNVMERLVIMSDESISDRDLPPKLGGPSARPESGEASGGALDVAQHSSRTLREFREFMETAFINYQLGEHGWNISRTAQALGIERTNLHKKLRALGIRRQPRTS